MSNSNSLKKTPTSSNATDESPQTSVERRSYVRRNSKPEMLSTDEIRALRKLDENEQITYRRDNRRENTRQSSRPKPFISLETEALRKKNA